MHTAKLLALVTLAGCAKAHFVLHYPQSLGFDDNVESSAPCGGFNVVFADNDTTVQVGGFAVALFSTHPAADFLFRASLMTEAPFNWTNLLPVVSETGIGAFCLPDLTVPAHFSGQQGVIQVIQDGPDGVLYQCAVVNFVSGTNSTVGSACINATGVAAEMTSDSTFDDASVSDSSNSSASASTTATGVTSGASTGSATASAASGSISSAGAIALATPVIEAVIAGVGIWAFF